MCVVYWPPPVYIMRACVDCTVQHSTQRVIVGYVVEQPLLAYLECVLCELDGAVYDV